jgi:hypothetical protein
MVKLLNKRLSKLKILELRENRLRTLPKSLDNLQFLERLDIGTNEFELFVCVLLSLKYSFLFTFKQNFYLRNVFFCFLVALLLARSYL